MVGKSPSVLIVDDETGVCELLDAELSERGCLCSVAYDGEDALSKLASQDFDVALLDIRLPGISGIELLSRIHTDHCSTEAIMITALGSVSFSS